MDKDFSDMIINNSILEDGQDTDKMAKKTLKTFYQNNPNIEYVNSSLEDNYEGYEWDLILKSQFFVIFEGETEKQLVTVSWETHGCSCNDITEVDFSDVNPKYDCECIPFGNEWYRLNNEETEIDCVKKYSKDNAIKMLESQIIELTSKCNDNRMENSHLKFELKKMEKDFNQKLRNYFYVSERFQTVIKIALPFILFKFVMSCT